MLAPKAFSEKRATRKRDAIIFTGISFSVGALRVSEV
jgi:hypothetical protein